MIFAGWARCCAASLMLILLLCGCMPATESQLDEQKEPNFIAGKNLLGQMDYEGAAEAFERAVEVNPHSASAHFELGCLYEEKLKRPNDAIYHYTRYLRYSHAPGDKGKKPNYNEELVQQRINSCTLEMAKGVALMGGPVSSAAQRELDRLTQENKNLNSKIDALQQQLSAAQSAAANSARLLAAQPVATPAQAVVAPAVRETASSPPPPVTADPAPAIHPKPRVATSPAAKASSRAAIRPRPSGSARMLTYVVKAGDTLELIASKQGISTDSILAANPHLGGGPLVPGKAINVPSR